jgi:hypothetical protein
VIFVVTFVIGTVLGLAWGSGRLKISWTWSGSDILALATLGGILATAIGTVVLAWKTSTLASGTAEMAEATRTEARAAKDTVTEIQKDRELTFRPYVSWKISGGTRVNGVNLGKGPALNTVFCVVEEGERLWSWYPDLVDFSPGQTITDTDDVGLRPKQRPAPPRPQVGRVVPRKVAFCEDQLGNRYRFLPGSVIADVWRPGENKPDWVMWYEGTAPIAPRT